MNIVYDIAIQALSPIHIGDGRGMSGLDYFCYTERIKSKEEKTSDRDQTHVSWLYKYDIDSLMQILDPEDKNILLSVMKNQDIAKIANYIFSLLENSKNENSSGKYKERFLNIPTIQKIQVTNTFYKHRKTKIVGQGWQAKGKNEQKRNNEKKNQQSQMKVMTFINSLGRWYIPGSSLKGSLRTILSDQEIEEGPIEIDPFKKMIVQDTQFLHYEDVMIDALARMGGKGAAQKQGDGQFAEFVQPGTITSTKIIIKSFLNEIPLKKIDFSSSAICQKANCYTKNKLEQYINQIDNLKKHRDLEVDTMEAKNKLQKLDTTQSEFKKIMEEVNSCQENQCIVSLGFGTGYWFKTFQDIQKHPGVPRHLVDANIHIPRTNRTTNLQNLGFMKLTFTS